MKGVSIPMRISAATATIAVLAATLVSCSSISPGPPALPGTNASALNRSIATAYAAGKPLARRPRPTAAERAAFKSMLERVGHDPRSVAIWLVNTQFYTLLGLDRSGSKVVDSIDVGSKQCVQPGSVKIDESQNVWVNCFNAVNTGGPYIGNTGSEQEYTSSGSLRHTYKFPAACPPTTTGCQAYSDDGGPDNHGHVFADLSYGLYFKNGQQGLLDVGFYWWNVGHPKAKPAFIDLGPGCQPICAALWMDTDLAGNIWFTYIGYNGVSHGYGLAEIINPTSNPKVVTILPQGQYKAAAGVFRSDAGKTLNVVDSSTRDVYQYRLPVTPASKPFRILGPTPAGFSQGGQAWASPITGGFNKAGTKVAIGDANGGLTSERRHQTRGSRFSI